MMNDPLITQVRFSIGELVRHRLFGYRGVVVDVDKTCQASDEWYESVAKTRPPRDKPWYHVLVHGSNHATYVAERNLQPETDLTPIDHPMVEHFFAGFEGGRYRRTDPVN